MRKLILIIVGALIAGTLLGQLMLSVHGFWHIRAGHYDIYVRSFMGGLILLIVLFTLGLFLLRLLRGMRHPVRRMKQWRSRVRSRRAVKRTNRGVEAMGQGRWKKAEKLLRTTADDAPTPVVNYLFAAQAAHYQGHFEQAQELLQVAARKAPSAVEAIDLVKAELMIDRQQYEQALATLTRLLRAHPEHPQVLKLLRQVYARVNDWTGMRQILPRLQKLTTERDYAQLEDHTYAALFDQLSAHTGDTDTLLSQARQLWRELPSERQEAPSMIALYSDALVHGGATDDATKLLRQGIERHWSPLLLQRYSVLPEDAAALLKKAEGWLEQHSHDSELLLCLGRLSVRCGLWGKAQRYFEDAGRLRQDSMADGELARLFFLQGDRARSELALEKSLGALQLPQLPGVQ
ncbi:heme biosynthesis protein HemY [Zymobacter palmae]|uniref:Uncharacterized enzyme of heme biosynthesis n=1 Tax=Zymobacter palmae TaxID=33074 RepID=A0A348HHR2_9GAMM|nr:heme biosynthesis HemY N-terminal domain-containing protein [Zymobacter palmae]BBG31164.1 uncharacterized enzyme of heme biosynthesis [Zymobacter palmae]